MKHIRQWLAYTAYIFLAECVIIAALMHFDVMEKIAFAECAFALVLMALGTAAVIELRDALLPDRPILGVALGLLGCCAVVLGIGSSLGWMSLQWDHVLFIVAITVAVYACVWLMCVLQNRKDADEMNATLAKIKREKH